jgi:hypothetical protein
MNLPLGMVTTMAIMIGMTVSIAGLHLSEAIVHSAKVVVSTHSAAADMRVVMFTVER